MSTSATVLSYPRETRFFTFSFLLIAVLIDALLTTHAAIFSVFTKTIIEEDSLHDLILSEIEEGVSVKWIHFTIDNHVEFVA